MTRYRPTWLLAAVLLVGAAACTDTSELEERVAALEARPAVVVERVAEVQPKDTSRWIPIGRDRIVVSEGTAILTAGDNTLFARFRLQVAGPAIAYDVLVPADCFDLIRVGDPWPSHHDACR